MVAPCRDGICGTAAPIVPERQSGLCQRCWRHAVWVVNPVAMMGDRSLCKRRWNGSVRAAARRPAGWSLRFSAAQPINGHLITQRRVADAGELVGERTGRLCRGCCAACTASAHWRRVSSVRRHARCATLAAPQHRARTVGEQHSQVAIAALARCAPGGECAPAGSAPSVSGRTRRRNGGRS